MDVLAVQIKAKMKEFIKFGRGQTKNRWKKEFLDFDKDYLLRIEITKYGNSNNQFLVTMNLLLFLTQTKGSFSNYVDQILRFFNHPPMYLI